MSKIRNLLAMVLSAAMLLALIYVPGNLASAADADAAATSLSNYGDTEYTTFTTAKSEKPIVLRVTGLDADYNRVPLTEEEATDVTWRVLDGSLDNVTVSEGEPIETENDGWISEATVSVAKTTTYGYAVIEAKLANGGSIDLTIAVNPAEGMEVTPVTGVTVNVVAASGVTATYENVTVGETPEEGQYEYVKEKYPNALAAVLGLPNETEKATTNNIVKAANLQPVVGGIGFEEYISSIVMGTKTSKDETVYPITENGYWLYSVSHEQTVTDENGNSETKLVPYPFSAIVGMGTFMLHDGDVITLTCYEVNED